MKINLATGAAVAFAGFAVVYAIRQSGGPNGGGTVQTVWDMMRGHRQTVGALVPQSTAYARWLAANPGSYDGREYWG